MFCYVFHCFSVRWYIFFFYVYFFSLLLFFFFFFFSSRRRHTRLTCDWSSDVCSSDLTRPELAASATDECLRFDGPIILTPRVLHADVEFGRKTLPKDAKVWGMLAAADRDPAVFPEPDRFDIARRPNDHLAFGGGPHFCLGAHLAKLEGEIAIAGLVTRFADLRLVAETVEWGASLFRVPGNLPITFRAH